jgi:hypothetical protein
LTSAPRLAQILGGGHVVVPAYDDSAWPVFRVRLAPVAMPDDEFARYLEQIDKLFLRGERFALVIDAREAPAHTAKERQEIAKHMRASFERYPHRLAALAIVLESALQRGIFTAINWLAGPTYPTRSFRTQMDAEVWLRQMLEIPKGSGTYPQVTR